MATIHQNLSDHDKDAVPSAKGMTFAIVAAEWNASVTDNLLRGAYDTLLAHGAETADVRVIRVPGTFELPGGAQMVLDAHPETDAVICIGSVIQGQTRHFDFVCEGATIGIQQVALQYHKPVIFGVLTDNTLEQAKDRSGGKHGNKGDEAAITAIKMVALQKNLKEKKDENGMQFRF